MKNYAYLINVDELGNHNKYYEIVQNDDMSLDVTYGRVGETERHHHYAQFEKTFEGLRKSKIDKGYDDVTALHSVKESVEDSFEDLQYQPIADAEINSLVEELIKASNDFMRTNYSLQKQQITSKMIAEAEHDIELLSDIASDSRCSVWQFNQKLKDLFLDIPRSMNSVDVYMASTSSDFQRIIEREQDMIDNIKGQLMPVQKKEAKKEGTVLDAYGLSIRTASYKQEDEIISHLGRDYGGKSVERRFMRAFVVENQTTRQNYEEFKDKNNLTPKDCRLFYHGSKTENWFSILKQGLSLHPSASITGKMFGNGLYFAPDARKSLNYMDVKSSHWNNGTRDSGFMAVYSVALGQCYKPCGSLGSRFNKSSLPSGCLSVYADKHLTGLENDEYVVYDQAQCTVKYLLEMADYRVRELEYSVDRNALRNHLQAGFGDLVKVPNGLRAEVSLEKLPAAAQAEMGRILSGFDVDRLYFDCNKNGYLSISCEDSKGEHLDIEPSLTKDDLKFLCREMKKGFAECEHDWKELVKKAEPERVGTVVYSKTGRQDELVRSEQVHTVKKEGRD